MGNEIKDFQIKLVTSADLAAAQAAAGVLKETAKASTEGAKEQVNNEKTVNEAEQKSFASKKQLKDAVRGLAQEFPLLGRVAHLALNPISFVVAGAAGAWSLWTTRIREATEALGGVEMPDVSDSKLRPIRQAAEAWKEYGEAIKVALANYNSAEEVGKRVVALLAEEKNQRLEQIKLVKAYAAAQLEAEKPNISAAEYARRKAALNADAIGAEAATKWEGQQDEWYAKNERIYALKKEAADKEAEARSIKVGEESEYADVEKGYRASAEAAAKGQGTSRAWLGEIAAYRDNEGGNLANIWRGIRLMQRYGYDIKTPAGLERASALERENISNFQVPIDDWQQFQAQQSGRAALRTRRSTLFKEAGTAAAGAAVGLEELGDEAGTLAGSRARDIGNTHLKQVTARLEALVPALEAGRAEEARLKEKLAEAIESRKIVNEALIEELRRVHADNLMLAGQLRNLRNNR